MYRKPWPAFWRARAHYQTHISAIAVCARLLSQQYMIPKVAVDMSKLLQSPMPGTLVSVAVKPGDIVEAGAELAVVEVSWLRLHWRVMVAMRLMGLAPRLPAYAVRAPRSARGSCVSDATVRSPHRL